MSLISENIIPGDQGKTFGTNANKTFEIELAKTAISKVEGVKEVIVNQAVYPFEITVSTSRIVAVKDIQKAAISVGFHVILKGLF